MKDKVIEDKINKEYAIFENKVKPLRQELKALEKRRLISILSKHKGIIYRKKYGKDYETLKVLKSITKKGRLSYINISIERREDYHVNYIKERNKITKEEAIDIIQSFLEEEDSRLSNSVKEKKA